MALLSFVTRSLVSDLLFLDTLVLLDRLGGDGGGGFGGVVLLDVGGGGGDGAPCLAAGHARADKDANEQSK